MRRLYWLAVGTLLLFNIILPVANDSTLAQTTPPDTAADGQPEVGNADLDDYVTAYGVTPEEAREHWAATDLAGELQAELIKNESHIFGGVWIEREPTFAVVVGVVAGGEKAVQPHIESFGLTEVVRVQQVQRPLEQLKADQVAVSRLARGAGIDVAAGVDQSQGRVVVFVDTAAEARALLSVHLPESAAVVAGALPTPGVEIYGGLAPTTCTTGFNVKSTTGTTEGVSLAGHCGDTQQYQGSNLPLVQQRVSGSTDAQWHTTPAFTDPNKIRVTSSGTTRNVTSRKPLNQMVENEHVCKFGKITLFDCGTIRFVPFDPGDQCVPGSTNTYALVVPNPNAGDLMDNGDSGGPVFHDNPAKAYGTMNCHSGVEMVFMPQNFLPNIGVEVDITTP